MTSSGPFPLDRFPVHLGLGATVERLDEFTGDAAWYEAYARRTESDGAEGRLVTVHTFVEPWGTWEVHPHGEELVVCLAGGITLHQETDDGIATVALDAGEAVVNPPGVWHTADVSGTATVLFVTAGLGTENRDR